MSLATLETAILEEAKIVAKNPKLRRKDMLEWSTGVDAMKKPALGETVLYLPTMKIYVCIEKKRDLRR